MPVEIERKYLVTNTDLLKNQKGTLYKQGYLAVNKNNIVRVRLIEKHGFLTIKGKTIGIKRMEYEYEVPFSDAKEMLDLCQSIIEKKRYKVKNKGNLWEIDIFLGLNKGLIIAEIELEDPQQQFPLPPWVGKEVSHDFRYANSNLINNPFSKWKEIAS
jgi:adenylate cyclase